MLQAATAVILTKMSRVIPGGKNCCERGHPRGRLFVILNAVKNLKTTV